MTEDTILRALRRKSPLIGDDCAVVPSRCKEDLLYTTDYTIEGVHFSRQTKPEAVGARALGRSLSDIAAMGGTPRFCLVSLALGPWTTEAWVKGFYRGLLRIAKRTQIELAGGDLSHANQLVSDVMVCGAVPSGKALRRSGAQIGDTIYVSGPLGGWMHKPVITPRLELGRQLVGKATACMDISDGLALDLCRLCTESGVGAQLHNVPLLAGATLEEALHAGEDYELLYTAPARRRITGIPIGMIVNSKPGVVLYDGKRLPPRGYDHITRSRTRPD